MYWKARGQPSTTGIQSTSRPRFSSTCGCTLHRVLLRFAPPSRTVQGVHQLARALHDFAEGRQVRAVDEEGKVRKLNDGVGVLTVNDIYLRSEFPPPGKARAPRPGDTAVDRYHNGVVFFSKAVEELEQSFVAIGEVTGDDGRSLVDARGVDPRTCAAWREVLRKIDEELVIWGRTFRRTFASDSTLAHLSGEGGERTDDDLFDEPQQDEAWDNANNKKDSNLTT